MATEALSVRPTVAAPNQTGASSNGPLEGVRVLDLSQWLAGPAAAALLGDFGADVIMVELPPASPLDGTSQRSIGFPVTNRNKRSIALDVRSAPGRDVFLELVRRSDVVVENFRPGTLERWGIAPSTLFEANPALVLLRSSGFGQTGPYAGRAAFNPVGLALGGVTYLGGWPDRPPLRDGIMAGDYSTALANVLGVMAALLRRDVDGHGQVVDTAMFEVALRMTGDLLAVRTALGIRRERAGGDWPLYPASLTAAAADGRFVATSAGSEAEIAAAVDRLGGRADDPARARAHIATMVRALPAAEAVAALRRVGLAASAVNSVADLVSERHLWERGDLMRISDPQLGEIITQGVVPRLTRTPGRVSGWSRHPGSDDEAIFRGLRDSAPDHIRLAAAAGPGDHR
jgi:formyl-CoA transferase